MDMTETRFIVSGDLHFRIENPRNRKDTYFVTLISKLDETCALAQKHNAAAVIIPGDIFDSANVGLSTIIELAFSLKRLQKNYGIPILTISGNHDLPAGNKSALSRTPYGLLSKLGYLRDLEKGPYMISNVANISGWGFDFKTDTEDGAYQFNAPEYAAQTSGGIITDIDTPKVHIVHSMLLASSPTFPMRHTLINQVETNADIIVVGHSHDGFGIIRRKDGKLFINPGALCRLSASKAEMERTVQVALLTIRSKTDFDAELIPLQSARPAEEVLDREAIVEKLGHENWLDSFFEKLSEEGEAKFMEVREIVDSIASREKILPVVKEEALRRIGEAREKLGRGAA
jgi:exonuclease SbcD